MQNNEGELVAALVSLSPKQKQTFLIQCYRMLHK
jgi:hypothetical protein